mgnify:FL=1
MDKNKHLTVEKTFKLAVENHKKNNLADAQDLYNQILKIDPEHAYVHNNLGTILKKLGDYQKAKGCYEKAIEIDPNYANAHNNLGLIFKELGDYQKAKSFIEKAITIDPIYGHAHNNLGLIFKELGDYQKAKDCYEKAIEIDPYYANAYNNLGVVFRELKENQKAVSHYEQAIKINPNYLNAHNNLGVILYELGQIHKAKNCYQKIIEIDSNNLDALNNLGTIFEELGEIKKAKSYFEKVIKSNKNYMPALWNLHSCATNIDEALSVLIKMNNIDNTNFRTKTMIAALKGYKGNFDEFNKLLNSPDYNHSNIRSMKWIFSLPKLPKIFFNRCDLFDAIIELTENSRPFYEFGVWNGLSFQYLINTYKKGFGFDTFTGLPETWDNQPIGAYSNFGVVPKIKGGEFIVGKFEDTLPEFFSQKRPKASLINFDADLYSSTLCALNYSNKIIDDKTILVFDELLNNPNWENDEYKALNDYCTNQSISYEVLAFSFFSNQVAVKLITN